MCLYDCVCVFMVRDICVYIWERVARMQLPCACVVCFEKEAEGEEGDES